jgi:hypothetical protein
MLFESYLQGTSASDEALGDKTGGRGGLEELAAPHLPRGRNESDQERTSKSAGDANS